MARALGDGWLLPDLNELNRPWFTSGALAVQECTACGAVQHPPDDVCGSCQGFEFHFRNSRGTGRVESAVVVHHPVHPALADAIPYAVVVVSLDDMPGVHAIGNVLGTPPGDVRIGQRVRAVFEEVSDPDGGEALRIPQWEVVDAGA